MRTASPVERADHRHVRVFADDFSRPLLQGHHGGERGVFCGLGRDLYLTDIFFREKSFRDHLQQPGSGNKGRQRNGQNHPAVGQGQVQHAGVAGQGGVEGTLKAAHHDTGALHVRLIFQKAAGQHRHQGQRHKGRHHNRQAHHHRKFVEQQADHAGHEKDGNEHRDQRHRDRNNGEAHFARTAQGRLKRVLTLFHVADDVLQHHNGIVHHQADSEGQAQERDVVEAVVQAPKQCHRTNQRHG